MLKIGESEQSTTSNISKNITTSDFDFDDEIQLGDEDSWLKTENIIKNRATTTTNTRTNKKLRREQQLKRKQEQQTQQLKRKQEEQQRKRIQEQHKN